MVDFTTKAEASNKQDKLKVAVSRFMRKQNIVVGTWTIKQVGRCIHMEAKAPKDECFKVIAAVPAVHSA